MSGKTSDPPEPPLAWISWEGKAVDVGQHDPLATALYWAGRLKHDRPPLKLMDIQFMIAESLAFLVLPLASPIGPLTNEGMNTILRIGLGIAGSWPQIVTKEELLSKSNKLWSLYWRWASWLECRHESVYDYDTDATGLVRCLGVNQAKVQSVLAGDPRRAKIHARFDEFHSYYGLGIFDQTPLPTQFEKAYLASPRKKRLGWNEAKRRLKSEAGVEKLANQRGTAAAVEYLLGSIWGEDGAFVLTKDRKLRPNAGKAWDRLLNPIRTEKKRAQRGQRTVSIDADAANRDKLLPASVGHPDSNAANREADRHAIAAVEAVRKVASERRAMRSGSKASNAVRKHMEALLTDKIGLREVARAENCDLAEVVRAFAKELQIYSGLPSFHRYRSAAGE